MQKQNKLVVIFKLLKRILVHKFWVAYYCFQIGLYWQGLTHDLSKFSWTELKGGIKYWDDEKSSLANEREKTGYSETFLHHRGRNPHHYEYWIHSLDNGGIPAPMPRKYALELVCDYLAACKTYGNNPRNEYDWWSKYAKHMRISGSTKYYINGIFLAFKQGLSLRKSVEFADTKMYNKLYM